MAMDRAPRTSRPTKPAYRRRATAWSVALLLSIGCGDQATSSGGSDTSSASSSEGSSETTTASSSGTTAEDTVCVDVFEGDLVVDSMTDLEALRTLRMVTGQLTVTELEGAVDLQFLECLAAADLPVRACGEEEGRGRTSQATKYQPSGPYHRAASTPGPAASARADHIPRPSVVGTNTVFDDDSERTIATDTDGSVRMTGRPSLHGGSRVVVVRPNAVARSEPFEPATPLLQHRG
jgi:hypothetical protein